MPNPIKNFFKPDPQIRNWKLYVTKQGNSYYVGISSYKDVRKRIKQHGTRKGARWTWIHRDKALEIVETRDLGRISRRQAENIENDVTRKYRKMLGGRKVRGGYMSAEKFSILPTYNPGSYQDVLQILLIALIFTLLIFIIV